MSRPRGPSVLMTADAVGGVWTYALDLARGLSAAGVRVHLAILGPPPSPDQRADAGATPRLELIETGLPLDWTAEDPDRLLRSGEALQALARRLAPDLVHLNSPALAAAGRFDAPVLAAAHSCLATWWSAVKDGPMPSDFRWRSRLHWQGMLNCDAVVAPSAAFAEATARAYDMPRPAVVHNGRRRIRPPATGRREPLVFTSGRLWDEGKNLAVLDRAAALSGVRLVAAGPLAGPGGAQVDLTAAETPGLLSAGEVAANLARAPVYATAALYEPFGLGVLEAAQAGCALLLSDIPTFRELWDGAARFAPADDAGAFAAAFRELLADERACVALGRAAAGRAERYGAEAMVAGLIDLYRRLQPSLFREAA